MPFLNNIPQPGDFLDTISQPQLLGNMQQLDSTFGVDHYRFSDGTANNGKHNQVTTPLIVGGVHPTTIAAEPKIYAMQDSANAGVLNYSRGPSNAVPTPITFLSSPATPITLAKNTPLQIFDFAGLNLAYGNFWIMDSALPGAARCNFAVFEWTGVALQIFVPPAMAASYSFNVFGSVFSITNFASATSTLYWTIQFIRIQ